MSDSGIGAVIVRELTKREEQPKPMPGHSFVGYRRKVFDQFEAVFRLGEREVVLPEYTCEKIAQNAGEGTEAREAAILALKYWPQMSE